MVTVLTQYLTEYLNVVNDKKNYKSPLACQTKLKISCEIGLKFSLSVWRKTYFLKILILVKQNSKVKGARCDARNDT